MKKNNLPFVYYFFPIITSMLIFWGNNVFDIENPALLLFSLFSVIISIIILYNFIKNNVLSTNRNK